MAANNRSEGLPVTPSPSDIRKPKEDGTPFYYNPDKSPSTPQPHSPGPAAVTGVGDDPDHMDLVGQRITLGGQMCLVRERINCRGQELYALECEKSMTGYDGRCPRCGNFHVRFDRSKYGFYVSVKEIHDKMQGEKSANERAKGPKDIVELPSEKNDLPPRDCPIIGKNKGIEGDSNSCYMDSTIFCMFAYSRVFDSLLHMKVDRNQSIEELQTLLRENIVNVLRSKQGLVGRDALFHLRDLLSKATNDQSFKEMEKDPSEFLRALERLFHYAPLKTISSDQSPDKTRSNITTNIIWEMFDANPNRLHKTNIADIFRNSLVEVQVKLATIPSVLILVAPRHARSQRSYPYIIPDREIILDHKIVQLFCLDCGKTDNDSDPSREFYFCEQCCPKVSSSSSASQTDATVTCYCLGCLEAMHKKLPREEVLHHHVKQMKSIKHKLKLFAVLCIEMCHYVAFVKCHKADQQDEWIFFDSMSDRIHNEKNIPCVDPVPNFDEWIEVAEDKKKNYFDELDKRRKSGRPTAREFNEDEMRRLRLFRDGAFFFYENAYVDYQ